MATEIKVRFKENEFNDLIEVAAEAAIQAGVEVAYQHFARRIPNNRRRTRRALRLTVSGLLGEVGIRFPVGSRYQSQGTTTEKIMTDAWLEIKPTVAKVIENTFVRTLQEFQQ